MAESARHLSSVPNRFERRREKTRLELIEAAERVISSKGYHQTRIADIASEADVGLGTFYLHFKTKNEIFVELIEHGAAELRSALAEAKAGVHSPAEKLKITIDTILDAAAEAPELFRIVFGHSPAFLGLMVRVHEVFIGDLRDELKPVAGDQADAIAHLTIGMLSQAISWLLASTDLSHQELKNVTVNFALGGLERAAGYPIAKNSEDSTE
ncbi:MAG: TetR/AcrR family transcriptional regulator [Candidatus Binatus sp.]|jgi:AcrR family transcriptional regulator|nr:TetR/AcrR family transcriptional regulator [Candidatus Binatus sp.]